MLSTAYFSTVDLDQPVSLKLKSLSFDHIEFSEAALEELIDVVTKRCDLDGLTMRYCRVPHIECRAGLEDLVEYLVWEVVTVIGPTYEKTESEGDSYWEDDSDDDDYGYISGQF